MGSTKNSSDLADGVKFTARFRTPFPLFRDLSVPLCVEHNVLNIRRENAAHLFFFESLLD